MSAMFRATSTFAAALVARQVLPAGVAVSLQPCQVRCYVKTTDVRPFASSRSAGAASSPSFGRLSRDTILSLPSMPAISPSYPHGPFRFVDREYLLIAYQTDPKMLRRLVPWPLQPESDVAIYEWINMPDSSGFGSYSESGCVIPCILDGQPVNYTLSMYLDDEPPTAAGRELWGFPKRHASPSLRVEKDTLVGTLRHAGQLAAMGTMTFKHQRLDLGEVEQKLMKQTCNLRLIPDVDGGLASAQLVAFNLTDVDVKEAWAGPARLHFNPHVTAPASVLPVRKVLGGTHTRTNLTLPLGQVVVDYNAMTLEQRHEAVAAATGDDDFLHPERILQAPAMPITAPSYKRRVDALGNREYLVIKYETDRNTILDNLPYNVEAEDSNIMFVSWVRTEGTGIGAYNKFNVHIPCRFQGEAYLFSVLSVMDSGVSLNAGREIYGQPCKYGFPTLTVEKDTLAATLSFGEQQVASATSVYKHQQLDLSSAASLVSRPELNLKFIPGVNGSADIAQLVAVEYDQVHLDHSTMHTGPARFASMPHVNAPVADFPVLDQNECRAYHIRVSHMKQRARVVHDYLAA